MGRNIMIRPHRVRGAAQEIQEQGRAVSGMSSELWDMKNRLRRFSNMEEVCQALNTLVEQTNRQSRTLIQFAEATDRIADLYERREEEIYSKAEHSKRQFQLHEVRPAHWERQNFISIK